jgi:hypothetical protein
LEEQNGLGQEDVLSPKVAYDNFEFQISHRRMALLVLGISSPTAAIWGGVLRLPMTLPVDPANWISFR